MISKNGTTWTDEAETHAYADKFKEKYPKEAIGEPCCSSCSKVTCYVVEDVHIGESINPKTKEKKTWAKFRSPGIRVFANNVSFFLEDDMAFFPMKQCLTCGASQEGYQLARDLPGDLGEKHLREDRARRNMLEEEFKLWSNAFNLSYHKGNAAVEKAAAKSRKGPNTKYMPAESKKQENLV